MAPDPFARPNCTRPPDVAVIVKVVLLVTCRTKYVVPATIPPNVVPLNTIGIPEYIVAVVTCAVVTAPPTVNALVELDAPVMLKLSVF